MNAELVTSAQIIYPSADMPNVEGLHNGSIYIDPFKDSQLFLDGELNELQRSSAIVSALINGHGAQSNTREVGLNIAVGAAHFITPEEVFITHAAKTSRSNTHGMHRIVEIKPNGELQGVNAITTCIISVVSEIIKPR